MKKDKDEEAKKKEECNKKVGEQLYDKLIVVDFGDIFMPADKAKNRVKKKKEVQQQNVKDLMENGLDIHFAGKDVHMVPFDKSDVEYEHDAETGKVVKKKKG